MAESKHPTEVVEAAELEAHAAGYKTSQGYRFWNLDYETMDVGDGDNARQLGQRGKYFDKKDVVFFDDFIYANLSYAESWTTSSTGSGSNPVMEVGEASAVVLDTGATAGGTSTISGPRRFVYTSEECRVKARIKISDVSEILVNFKVGYTNDYANAYWDGTEWHIQTKDGTTENDVASGVSESDDTWVIIELWYDIDNSKWKLLRNGTNIAESSSNLPSARSSLFIHIENITDTDVDCRCDYIATIQEI